MRPKIQDRIASELPHRANRAIGREKWPRPRKNDQRPRRLDLIQGVQDNLTHYPESLHSPKIDCESNGLRYEAANSMRAALMFPVVFSRAE